MVAKLYIDLDWVNESQGAIEQRIEIEKPGELGTKKWVEVAVVAADVVQYTDTPTVIDETQLTYRIVSVGDSGEVPSEPVTVTFPPPLVAPTSLSATYRYEAE